MGLVCYETATAETPEEIMELVKHGWELVDKRNSVAIFRKPLREGEG